VECGQTSAPKPNLFLAAVHALLLEGRAHELRRFYPSLGGACAEGDALWPAFRDFCLTHKGELLPLLQSRRVQTNEVARAAVLLPAFGLVAARTFGAPLALIEVGASAGLLLLFDRYAYDYGTGVLGPAQSPVLLRCESRGPAPPPVRGRFPSIASRTGIDLFPIDLREPGAATWLRALVWPDQTERAARLAGAIGLAASDPPTLLGGDALTLTPRALAQVPAGAVPVVFHCHTLNQFRPEDRERFGAMLAGASVGKSLYRISLEYMGGQWPGLTLWTYSDGALTAREELGFYQAHGDWLAWTLQNPD